MASGSRSRRRAARTAALLLAFALAAPAAAKVYFSQEEALALAFPDADRVERDSMVLSEEQTRTIERLAKAPLESRIVAVYTGRRGDEVLGYAFIDVHTVRTLPEAFLVVLSPDGEVRMLRLLAFYEPEEYKPADRWLEQFGDRRLDPDLSLKGEIHGIAGSTLSSRAVTSGVRRSLAIYEVMVRPGRARLSASGEGQSATGAGR